MIALILAIAASPAAAGDAPPDAGLAAVSDLGLINGRALACGVRQVAGRAKVLMLAHVPKTARYGDAYERATQQAYLDALQAASGCPDEASLDRELERVAPRLREAFAVPAPR